MSDSNNTKKEYDLEFRGTNLFSLVPLLAFVAACIAFFVVLKTYDMMDLYTGSFVALVIGSVFAKNWKKYWEAVLKGMTGSLVGELALIMLIVGMFGKLMTRGGVAQGFVWIGDKLGLHGGLFTAFTFVATCIIATATGTSIGTLFTAFPILYPSGILLGAHPGFLAGAILSGAIFGDNIGPISDTTIASAATQEYTKKEGVADIAGVVGSRLKYALIAAAAATICFAIFGGKPTLDAAQAATLLAENSNPKGLIMLIPVAILLFVAFYKRNIYIAATWGIITGTIIGLVFGIITPADILSVQDGVTQGFLSDGIHNMAGTVGYLYGIAGIMGILNACGLMDQITSKLMNSSLNKTAAGTEVSISLGLMVSSILLGSANGPAIIMWGPIANDLGKEAKLHPYRRANLMDGFGSTLPAIFPVTSAFIFIVVSLVNGLADEYSFVQGLSPVTIAVCTLHCIFLFVVLVFSVASGWGRVFEGEGGERVKGRDVSVLN